ncbi:MAG: hypothetical protein L0219_20620 [Phycisphaerales bacterium]|nr:hypothetical protein [Phycisphaerales bacterium]
MTRFIALLTLFANLAAAQCVMCLRTASAQQVERARVLNLGIIIMLIPALLIPAGFVWLLYRRSRTFADDASVMANHVLTHNGRDEA